MTLFLVCTMLVYYVHVSTFVMRAFVSWLALPCLRVVGFGSLNYSNSYWRPCCHCHVRGCAFALLYVIVCVAGIGWSAVCAGDHVAPLGQPVSVNVQVHDAQVPALVM